MGSTSKHGRAVINPTAPEALGICDKCGFLYNLRDLRFQWQWSGTGMINTQIRVCPTCMDVPNEQMRAIVLQPDPLPAYQPRPEPYAVDETNDYTLRQPIGKPYMFMASGDVTAALTFGGVLSAAMDAIGDLSAALSRGVQIAAAIDGSGNVTCDLDLVSPATFINTEGNDLLITEGSDFLITET